MNKILIYADTDINIIDGSSIWVISILKTLAEDKQNNITLLLKTPIIDKTLIHSVSSIPNVQIFDCWQQNNLNKAGLQSNRKRLAADDAIRLMSHLDKEHNYTTILLRGASLSPLLMKNSTILSKCIIYYLDNGGEDREKKFIVHSVFPRAKYIACQTDAIMQELIHAKIPPEKLFLLPPMIPNFNKDEIDIKRKGRRLIYSGKLSPQYNTIEMIEAFEKTATELPDSELYIIGAKYYNKPYVKDFETIVESMIKRNGRIYSFMRQSREKAMEYISKSDVCISWRSNCLDNNLELSTKLLEYGSMGKPVILNRTKLHEQLLGSDYPLFANSFDEYIQKTMISLTNDDAYQIAAKKMINLSGNYTFKEVYRKIMNPFIGVGK